MSGIDPITVYHFDPEKFETRAELVYPDSVLDEMARRFAGRIEDEVAQQVLARLGYVKASERGLVRPVLCCDCEHHSFDGYCCRLGEYREFEVEAYGYCSWGKHREDE